MCAVGLLPKAARSANPAELTPALDAELRADAAQAWKFFELKGKYLPGMLPAIAWYSGKSIDDYPALAMWDVGSLILGYVSARSLDLVSQAEFERRIAGVVSFLEDAVFEWRGKKLPNYQTYISDGRILEKGFNSTDAGRLLVALKVLDEYTGGSDGAKLVAGWDIAGTIEDGKMHDIKKGGKMIVDPAYVYANYVSQGYKLWNIDHLPPFDPNPKRDAEANAAFLEKVAKTGVVSTEPHVTEVLEFGASEPAEVLADVLYAAMQQRYADTGHLTCPSEAPIDHDPWFTYQGYELPRDGEEGKWVVGAADGEAKAKKFADANRLVASGGAFLWYAARPDAYSESLYRLVREKARIGDIGYSPGIYEASGEPDTVPDINNNSLILEAVAYILNGRKPLIELRLAS